MNISSILCTVYGKNLQSQNVLTSLVDYSKWLAQSRLNFAFCGLGVWKFDVFTDLRDRRVSFIGLKVNIALM